MSTIDRLNEIEESVCNVVDIVRDTIRGLESADDTAELMHLRSELARLREGVDAIYSKMARICIDLLRVEMRLQNECIHEYERAILHPEDYDHHRGYMSSPELRDVRDGREYLMELIDWLVMVMRDIDKAIERR